MVTVAGRVTAGREFGDLAFMQDRTGGIAVYNAQLDRGDSVIVRGKISRFNEMVEIIPDSVRKAGPTKEVLPGEVLLRYVFEHEGELVTVKRVSLKPPNHFFYPQRGGLLLSASDTLNYWVDGDTDIPGCTIPSTPVSVTGIVGRFKDQLQILPRSKEDIPGMLPFVNIIEPGTFSVMNWNVEFFGAERYGPSNDELQLENVSKLIAELQPAVVALQEVSGDKAFRDLIARLPGYAGRCSNRYSYSFDTSGDFPPQKLCFIYQKQVVKVVGEKVLFRKYYDEHPDVVDIFSSGRLPYLLEADILDERVYLVNYHGKSGDGASDLKRRELDARLLNDTLQQYYPGKKLMILGDFNDDVDMSIVKDRPTPYSVLRYKCLSRDLSDENWHSTISYNDVIDHQFVSKEMEDDWVSTRLVNPFALIGRYGATTSDHLPVFSQFQWKVKTGIKEENEVKIFPIPANDVLNVEGAASFEYHIFTATGSCVSKGSASRQITLDIPPGLYKVIINKGPVSQAFTFIRSD